MSFVIAKCEKKCIEVANYDIYYCPNPNPPAQLNLGPSAWMPKSKDPPSHLDLKFKDTHLERLNLNFDVAALFCLFGSSS